MKTRLFLLILLLISGAYMMVQQNTSEPIHSFSHLLKDTNPTFHTLTFQKKESQSDAVRSWSTNHKENIQQFLYFLDMYQFESISKENAQRKIYYTDTITLQSDQHEFMIFLEDQIIVIDDTLFFSITSPLDQEWLLTFTFHLQLQ